MNPIRWTECRVRYRCRCGTRGTLILTRTPEDAAQAALDAKAGTFPCHECETLQTQQPTP